MSDRIPVKPELLRWARERSRMEDDALAKRFPKYPDWLSGGILPTMRQLEKFAAQTFTPLGYFFLPAPPDERLPIPDFRTLSDRQVSRPSPHLLDTIHAAQLRQQWMHHFLIEQGETPLDFVGRWTLKESPDSVAAAMRKTLDLQVHWNRALDTWEEALRVLIRKIEAAGVLVMINGVVENSTHRPLDVEEFRGFALVDSHAPLIFINGTDAKAAQMFTLIHELAHLWLGKEGVSNFLELDAADNEIEEFCNKVAAEFLVPAQEMVTEWRRVMGADKPFARLARSFKVSPVVAARRALDLSLITRSEFFGFYNDYKEEAARRKADGNSGGGNFFLTLGTRLGKRFPAAIYSAAKEGKLDYREAYQLTGISGETFDRFGREFGFAV